MIKLHLYITGLFVLALSCSRKPFVSHKIKFEKVSDNCQNQQPSFRVVSNINGERYEFQKCLDKKFTKDMLQVLRQGDTVVAKFPAAGAQPVLFKITLDIDSYPRYNFITVDDETFIVTTSRD